jgi:salicylate hydroxylase
MKCNLLTKSKFANPTRWSLQHHLNTPTYFKNLICLLGDAAHASTPHQGAGAGQCLEDALILSHLLSLVSRSQSHPDDSAVNINLAFEAYDYVRRPRAQKVVKTSDDAGKMYCFADPECGSDVKKIVTNARGRFGWIWEADLVEEMQVARRRFKEFWKDSRRGLK